MERRAQTERFLRIHTHTGNEIHIYIYMGGRCACIHAAASFDPGPKARFLGPGTRVVSSTIARLQSRRKQFRLLSSSIKPKRNGHGIESVFCQGNCRRIRGKIARHVCFHPVKGMEIGEGGRLRDIDIAMSVIGIY